jgi:hypothetical protein
LPSPADRGWHRGQLDRGSIGLQLLTGRQPSVWKGRAAFLPATPYHENHQVQLLPGLPAEAWPGDNAIVTLADAGAGALARETAKAGSVTSPAARTWPSTSAESWPLACRRPCGSVSSRAACSPQLADQDATIVQLSRLGTDDLLAIRRQLTPTGRWVCQRCGRLWQDPRHPGRRWYDLVDDGPHVCPNCFSYSLTHPM